MEECSYLTMKTSEMLCGIFVLGLITVPLAGAVYASETESAKEMDLDKEDFLKLRNVSREAHREARLEERKARLMDAIERDCLDPQELESKMQMRGGRFAK